MSDLGLLQMEQETWGQEPDAEEIELGKLAELAGLSEDEYVIQGFNPMHDSGDAWQLFCGLTQSVKATSGKYAYCEVSLWYSTGLWICTVLEFPADSSNDCTERFEEKAGNPNEALYRTALAWIAATEAESESK